MKTKKELCPNAVIILYALCLLMLSSPVMAGLSHYTPGGLGFKNATCPPPGFWYAGYNQYYTAGTYKDNNGDTSATTDADITVFANVNQFNWMTEKKTFRR